MSWRIIQVTKPCRLSVKNKQFFYEPIDGDSLTIPLEDISVIVLDNKQVSLNNSFFSEVAEFGIVMFTSDASHIPSGVWFPFHNHSRYSEMAWQQVVASEPLKKRIWQKIVKAKINNQAEVLQKMGKDNIKKLQEISKLVQSGDTNNSEAFAAALYWKSLFDNFVRSSDCIQNSALNYGYAILRGCVARSLVGAGLIPCFGVHHCNKLNQFNLADDIIEPFRAFVDIAVCNINFNDKNELNTQDKQLLISILTKNCSYNDEEITIMKAIELSSISLAKSIKNNDTNFLNLPSFSKLPLFE